MRDRVVLAGFALAWLMTAGCTNHLAFVENSHIGLKASFEPNQPTPAEVDLGWRRAMFAMVPQKSAESANDDEKAAIAPGSVTVETSPDGKTQTITVVPDPDELMSLYSVYRGTIGFGDPIEVYHFMATGVAASNLLANESALRDLTKRIKADVKNSDTRPPETPEEEPQ
jgi:hypothetical protein